MPVGWFQESQLLLQSSLERIESDLRILYTRERGVPRDTNIDTLFKHSVN